MKITSKLNKCFDDWLYQYWRDYQPRSNNEICGMMLDAWLAGAEWATKSGTAHTICPICHRPDSEHDLQCPQEHVFGVDFNGHGLS